MSSETIIQGRGTEAEAYSEDDFELLEPTEDDNEDDLDNIDRSSAGKLVEEVIKPDPEVKSEDLELMIQSSKSIDELCEALNKTGQIEGSKLYSSEYVIKVIQDADSYLDQQIDNIIIYTITRQPDQIQEIFAAKVAAITEGRQLGIRSKVKELMKEKMNERFQERKKEFTIDSIKSVNSLEALYRVLNQFKEIRQGDKVYDKEKVIDGLKRAEYALLKEVEISDSASNLEKTEQEVKLFLEKEDIPNDSGIFNKACQLLLAQIKEKRLEKFSSDSQNQPKKSGRLKRFFGRFLKK